VALVAGRASGARSSACSSRCSCGAEGASGMILGGFNLHFRRDHRGLIIGLGEKFSEVYSGPRWRGHRNWFVPMSGARTSCCSRPKAVRESHIDRVLDPSHPLPRERDMIYREAGQFKTTYASDPAALPDPAGPACFVIGFLEFAFGVKPFIGTEYLFPRSSSRSSSSRWRDRPEHPRGLLRPGVARHRRPSWRWARMRPTTSPCACRT
jgi:hypothetical protein